MDMVMDSYRIIAREIFESVYSWDSEWYGRRELAGVGDHV